ncbi:MAG: hypothetical protein IKU80_01075 [Firmicutes bacterium]|nr:hypothetical protein [Bacillota bacterium]
MANCPFCDKNIINGVCEGCGYREYNSNTEEIWGEAVEKESTVIYEEPKRYEEKQMAYDKNLGSLWKWIFVLITIFYSPLVGLIASIVLITRPYLSYKSFGFKLLILSIVLSVFRLILVVLALFFNVAIFGTQQLVQGIGSIISIL